ncbi:glycosyltransferase family 2 protein [Candidatus Neptunochlamydia vexilliferae]|nr:glycosyltransferase family 2 protein [Candidatus Neptunochlamydia vexilliferae]
MKKSVALLFFFVVLGSTYYGLRTHFGLVSVLPKTMSECEIQKGLAVIHPVRKDRSIIAIVFGEDKFVKRTLASLFDQVYLNKRIVYIANGLVLEQAEAFAQEKGEKVEFINNKDFKPRLEILYEVIQACDSDEVIALIEGKDWLAHENVYDHLNCVYANPDVWMTYSRAISHPNYQVIRGKSHPDKVWTQKKFRQNKESFLTPLVTFYAGFFEKIKLQDLLYEGIFIDDCTPLAIQLPLLEMGAEHTLFIDEVSYIINEVGQKTDHEFHLEKVAAIETHLRTLPTYSNLSQLQLRDEELSAHRYQTDLILFSEDSPLQLYASLETLFSNGKDINAVYVLYEATSSEFQRAYLNLQNEFPTAHFLNICDYPGNDCGSLLQGVLESRLHASPYVVIGTDHHLFEEKIGFHDCIAALEKSHSDYFLLYHPLKEVGSLIPIDQGIYAYQLMERKQPFTLSLCRKTLFEDLDGVASVASFKKLWEKKLSSQGIVLFFEDKKTTVLDLKSSRNRKKRWGHKFIEGFKIDLASLVAETEEIEKGNLPLVKRGKKNLIKKSS